MERAVEDFGAAALVFAAKIAVFLGVEKRPFLRSAARAFDIAREAEKVRRRVEVAAEEAASQDPPEAREGKAPSAASSG